jgi:hypothetical protein
VTETGLVPVEGEWFVLNAREARWLHRPGRGARLDYTVDEIALRHGAGVERETTSVDEAYAEVPRREPRRYEESWLP